MTKPPLHIVVETPTFAKGARRIGISKAEHDALLDMLMAEPAGGELIVGGGGVRKVRLAKDETGKSGGYRVLTFYMGEGRAGLSAGDHRQDRGRQYQRGPEEAAARISKGDQG